MAQQPVQIWMLRFDAEGRFALQSTAKIVEATPMVDWQPTPPIQNSGALVSITHFQAVYCFGTRFAIGPDRADKLAANSRSLLSIRMAEGYWSQVFTEYTVKGLPEVLEEAAATSYEELQEALLALDLDPTQLLITANDWTYADPFDKPAIAARAARGNQPRILARPGVPGPQGLRFLHLARLQDLQCPGEAGPWRVIARLGGALGPCLTDDERRNPMSTVVVVADALRAALADRYGTSSDSLFAMNLKNFAEANALPYFVSALGTSEEELRTQMIDTLIFARADGAAYVLRSRLHLVQNRCQVPSAREEIKGACPREDGRQGPACPPACQGNSVLVLNCA